MISIIIGNLFSFMANILAFSSTRINNYKKMMLVQAIDASFSTLSNLILGGFSGALISFFGVIRNLYCAFFKKKKIIVYLILFTSLFLGIFFTFEKWYDILPILGSFIYGLIVLNTNDIKLSKIALIINCLFWIIYGLIIYNYVGIIFKIIMIFSCFSTLKNLNKDKK